MTLIGQDKREWKLCNKGCSSSKYLEDMNIGHNGLEECEEKVVRRVQYWNKCVENIKMEERIEARLDRKISGTWLCNIL